MVSAELICKALIEVSSKFGLSIDNLKLQKLAYYCQGYSYGLYGEPCFERAIEAWPHGPVVREEYIRYSHFSYRPITISVDGVYDGLPERHKGVVDYVISKYGGFTGPELEELTHEEAPWRDTFSGRKTPISEQKIKDYFMGVVSELVAEESKNYFSAMHDEEIEMLPMDLDSEEKFLAWLHS